MPRRPSSARPTLDLIDFARVRGELDGEGAPDRFPRLRDLLADGEGGLRWHLSGERRSRPEGGSDAYLGLRLTGRLRVACIRCLQPVAVDLDEDRLFRITATESQAERLDADSDEFDALVADPQFDVLGLVEDEAILALPIAPRHPACGLPVEPTGEPAATPERENPFSVLAALKRPGGTDEGA